MAVRTLSDRDRFAAVMSYRANAVPRIGLALSSHLLFLYTTQLGERFPLAAVGEVCRVANEARMFPLFASAGTLAIGGGHRRGIESFRNRRLD